MTAILAYNGNGYPFIVGDLLLSSESLDNNPISLPLTGYNSTFPTEANRIFGLRQKVNIVHPQLVVAWCGEFSSAEDLICRLKSHFRYETPTVETVFTYFNAQKEIIDDNIQLVGLVGDRDVASSFAVNSYSSQSVHFGKVMYDGTGVQELLQFLGRFDSVPQSAIPRTPMGAFHEAVLFSISLCGAAMQAETVTRKSLIERYGGGWEIATWVNGRFHKIDDIMYAVWFVEKSGSHALVSLHSVHKYSYHSVHDFENKKDVLCIVSYRLAGQCKDAIDNQKAVIDKDVHWVTPMYSDILPADIECQSLPDYCAQYLCNVLLTKDEEHRLKSTVDVKMYPDRQLPLNVVEKAGKTEFQIEAWLLKQIEEWTLRGKESGTSN